MEASGDGEEVLGFAEQPGQAFENFGSCLEDVWEGFAVFNIECLKRRFATHSATGGGVEIALQPFPVDLDVRLKLDGELVRFGSTGFDRCDVIARFDEAFGEEEAGGEFYIVAGGSHGDRDGLGVPAILVAIAETDFKGFLDGYDIGDSGVDAVFDAVNGDGTLH